MKQLPDEKTLLELLFLAQEAEQKAKELCDLTTEIDEKWRVRHMPPHQAKPKPQTSVT